MLAAVNIPLHILCLSHVCLLIPRSELIFQLSSDHSCLIWSTTTEEAKKLMQLEDENFVDAVNRAYVRDDNFSFVD